MVSVFEELNGAGRIGMLGVDKTVKFLGSILERMGGRVIVGCEADKDIGAILSR